jgi:hypothetical protein
MEWLVIAALAFFVGGLLAVVWEAERHSRKPTRRV